MNNGGLISVVCVLCCLFISSSTAGARSVIRQVTEGDRTYDDALTQNLSNPDTTMFTAGNPNNDVVRWKITHFSTLDHCVRTPGFPIGPRNWEFSVCPTAAPGRAGTPLSVWVNGMDFVKGAVQTRTFARYKVRVLNQINSNHVQKEGSGWFNVYPYVGYLVNEVIPMNVLMDASKGFLVNDQIIMEFEIQVS